jgi:SPP1 family holin
MFTIDKNLIVRIVVSAVALINSILAVIGIAPLDLDEDAIYQFVSVLFVIGTWVWGFWKNNNFSPEAKIAQSVLDDAKANKGTDA